jgi:hypothetical protein
VTVEGQLKRCRGAGVDVGQPMKRRLLSRAAGVKHFVEAPGGQCRCGDGSLESRGGSRRLSGARIGVTHLIGAITRGRRGRPGPGGCRISTLVGEFYDPRRGAIRGGRCGAVAALVEVGWSWLSARAVGAGGVVARLIRRR